MMTIRRRARINTISTQQCVMCLKSLANVYMLLLFYASSRNVLLACLWPPSLHRCCSRGRHLKHVFARGKSNILGRTQWWCSMFGCSDQAFKYSCIYGWVWVCMCVCSSVCVYGRCDSTHITILANGLWHSNTKNQSTNKKTIITTKLLRRQYTCINTSFEHCRRRSKVKLTQSRKHILNYLFDYGYTSIFWLNSVARPIMTLQKYFQLIWY